MVKAKILSKEVTNYDSVEETANPKSRMSSKRESRCKSELGSRKSAQSSRKNLKSA